MVWLMFLQQPGGKTLTQNISGSVPGYETRVVPIAHPFLEDASAEILAEAAARRHQAVVAAVCLRKSADNSSGNQSSVRQHRQHHLHTSSTATNRPSQQTALAQCRSEGAHNVDLLTKLNSGRAKQTPGHQQLPRTHSQRRLPTGLVFLCRHNSRLITGNGSLRHSDRAVSAGSPCPWWQLCLDVGALHNPDEPSTS